MLYLAFICSAILTLVNSAVAVKDFKEKPENRVGIVLGMLVYTIPFIYYANEVWKRVF